MARLPALKAFLALIIFGLSLGLILSFPSPVQAQIDLVDYMVPDDNRGNYMDNGEYFYGYTSGNRLVITKSCDPRWYEAYTFDGAAVNLTKDTTWPATCTTAPVGAEAAGIYNVGDPGMDRKRFWSGFVGETYQGCARIWGQPKFTGDCNLCETAYTGYACTTWRVEEVGRITLASGITIGIPPDHGIALRAISGAGAGERVVFSKTRGWVEFTPWASWNGNTGPANPAVEACPIPGFPGSAIPGCSGGGPRIRLPVMCSITSSGAQDSRPDPCNSCNMTNLMTPACATAPTVATTVSWQRWEPGEDVMCSLTPGQKFVRREWGGQVTFDASNTTIPFVGKKGLEDEERYITDYLEGTALYYRDVSSSDPTYKEFTGVFRKLAPRLIQDALKQELVKRALLTPTGTISNAVHDYLVTNGIFRRRLREFSGNFPPDPVASMSAYLAWAASEWGQLWPYVPMFTREDTPGQVYPYLGERENDQFNILNPKAEIEQLPHVARMFELAGQIQNILLPSLR